MDSGLSDSGDTGDIGLLLSKYSSKSLQVDMNTFFLKRTQHERGDQAA